MIKVSLMCGLPGSGKSTVAEQLAKTTRAVIISRDSIRKMIAGSYDQYQKMVFAAADRKYAKKTEQLVMSMALSCAKEAIEDQRDIIIDETNITFKVRARWINSIKTYIDTSDNKKVLNNEVLFNCLWVKTPIETCIERRLKNTQ